VTGSDIDPTPSPRAVVEHGFDADGTAPLGALYDAANALGIADQPLRLAVRRLVDAGLVQQHGRGRSGVLHLTDRARLHQTLDLAYWDLARAQDAGAAPWDGRWHLIGFSVPEARRNERDALRTALGHLGAAPIAPGLVVSPHDLIPALEAELGRGVQEHLSTASDPAARHRGEPIAALVGTLWPLGTLRAGYAALERALDRWDRRPDDPAQALAGRIAVHTALDRAVMPDPLLPPELLPADWPGSGLRTRFLAGWVGSHEHTARVLTARDGAVGA
jgi:phenylacetic acid degradation operon negative regulatory protein